MKTKPEKTTPSWEKLGGPPAGTIPAVAAGLKGDQAVVFAGAQVGVSRSAGVPGAAPAGWERLPGAPGGIMSLAVSPFFEHDRTILAGSNTGVWISRDAGDTWTLARMSLSNATVLCIAFSPDYENDGVILAGSLQDGIFYSNDRGDSWSTRNFGILDSTVLALAFSPEFARDGTVFAATDTAIYFSYNHARAWKQILLPDEAAPVLSLAVSPDYEHDRAILAGTETQGLFRSIDRGLHWQAVEMGASSVNALLSGEYGGRKSLLCATEAGIFYSLDGGSAWKCVSDLEDVISLAMLQGLALAGTVERGLWASSAAERWEPVENLSMRTLLGLALPEGSDRSRTAYLFGPNEGIWKTPDGGATWEDLSEGLPTLDIYDLAANPGSSQPRSLAAASDQGVLTSADGGASWQQVSVDRAERVVYSPNGRILAASFPGHGIRYSTDEGRTWIPLPGAWSRGGNVAGLAVTNLLSFYIAHLEGVGETLSFWQGKGEQFENVLSIDAAPNQVVALWTPPEAAAGRPWFAGYSSSVWKFNAHQSGGTSSSMLFSDGHPGEAILSLSGIQLADRFILLANTGQRLYRSLDGETWSLVLDFGSERALKVVPTAQDRPGRTAYALLLGGAFARVELG